MGAPLIKWKSYGLKNPMARATGLGSAHAGVHHWMALRMTAVALIPLTLWLSWAVVHIARMDYAAFVAWLQTPVNAILMLLTVLVMFMQAALGAQVIIEDYLHNEGLKFVKMAGMKLVLTATCVACLFAILKVAL
ncbi:MAG: succinate dehydrogenase, hydrophobic membrane anchor protein [Rhodospirillales bacterium]|nr:succinate dehydrogenase, hydrophobic membrane anchor protein [Alphaproteobacteria bacterium]MCB9986967.1 succinate dehydrogenase, hydrophobic membrane anchor protein [Rhodospirillales bacterium]USO08258.1 MAG: succinate dehydrogenase, hydrophobic membrane anchor protein [Rhodospirillales bacterium]